MVWHPAPQRGVEELVEPLLPVGGLLGGGDAGPAGQPHLQGWNQEKEQDHSLHLLSGVVAPAPLEEEAGGGELQGVVVASVEHEEEEVGVGPGQVHGRQLGGDDLGGEVLVGYLGEAGTGDLRG